MTACLKYPRYLSIVHAGQERDVVVRWFRTYSSFLAGKVDAQADGELEASGHCELHSLDGDLWVDTG